MCDVMKLKHGLPCGWLPGVDGATIGIAIPHQSASAADLA
jgi:hypothetical protein